MPCSLHVADILSNNRNPPTTFANASQEIDQAVKKEVDQAVADAKASPELPLSEMSEDIYVHPIQQVRVRRDSFSRLS